MYSNLCLGFRGVSTRGPVGRTVQGASSQQQHESDIVQSLQLLNIGFGKFIFNSFQNYQCLIVGLH